MKNFTLQENILALLPMWNYNIAKPLKQFLDDGISLEMYYCIQALRWYEKPMKMSELSELTKTPTGLLSSSLSNVSMIPSTGAS